MCGKVLKHGMSLSFSLLPITFAEKGACPRLVPSRLEDKGPVRRFHAQGPAYKAANTPTRKRTGQLEHVWLGVAAANTQRMEFKDFPGEVFVQPRLAPRLVAACGGGEPGIGTD